MHGLALLFKHPRLESIYREESRGGEKGEGGDAEHRDMTLWRRGREKVSENDNDKGKEER